MAIRVVCERIHDDGQGKMRADRIGELKAVRDDKGRLELQPSGPWRVIEIRRTLAGDPPLTLTEVFLACSAQCEVSIWTEMLQKPIVEPRTPAPTP
jgi:hypothetical protein